MLPKSRNHEPKIFRSSVILLLPLFKSVYLLWIFDDTCDRQ
jgi:hypothetical protein